MPLKAARIEGFSGLDLRTDPADSGGATDALNVVLERGRVRSRDGFSTRTTLVTSPYFLGRARRLDGVDHLITYESAGTLTAFNSAYVPIATVASAAATIVGTTGVNIGTPAASYFYVGTPSTAGIIRRWDGATWTAPAVFGAAPFPAGAPLLIVGATTTDNRMIVCAGSRVLFSDPGAPETYGTNNYVDLTPGDGEDIRGVANFNNQTFIFKRSRFFVFYGQSTDSTGQPVFNFREINTGIGLSAASLQAVCAGVDGVYFVGRDGIYRTTGGSPVRLSAPLDPLFTGEALPFYAGPAWDGSDAAIRLAYVDRRLYVANRDLLLVHDFLTDAWVPWSTAPIGAMTAFAKSSTPYAPSSLFIADLTSNRVASLLVGATVDFTATAIVSRYRSGFEDFGGSGRKTIRETILEGIGAPTLKWSTDYGALATGTTVTLGTSPATAVGRQSRAVQGRRFSYQIGASSGAWTVDSVQPNLMAERPAYVT